MWQQQKKMKINIWCLLMHHGTTGNRFSLKMKRDFYMITSLKPQIFNADWHEHKSVNLYMILLFTIKKTAECWATNGLTGEDWFSGYMTRFPNLALHRPEERSLSRATSFNWLTMLQKYKFSPNDINHTDETVVIQICCINLGVRFIMYFCMYCRLKLYFDK